MNRSRSEPEGSELLVAARQLGFGWWSRSRGTRRTCGRWWSRYPRGHP